MIQHTVCFTLVHPEGSAEEADYLQAASALRDIPGVTNFRIARQVSSYSDLKWQIAMDFADQAAYDAYTASPAHVAFVNDRWKNEVSDFTEFDFIPV